MRTIKIRFKYIASPDDINNLGRYSAAHTIFIDTSSIYKKGDKIAQLVFQKSILADVEQCSVFNETQRGSGGFGSTGN